MLTHQCAIWDNGTQCYGSEVHCKYANTFFVLQDWYLKPKEEKNLLGWQRRQRAKISDKSRSAFFPLFSPQH